MNQKHHIAHQHKLHTVGNKNVCINTAEIY